MTTDDTIRVRARIKERLHMIEKYGKAEPYTNDPNTKGRSFPLGWVIIILTIVVVVATWRGW
jgi:hypothetical protein